MSRRIHRAAQRAIRSIGRMRTFDGTWLFSRITFGAHPRRPRRASDAAGCSAVLRAFLCNKLNYHGTAGVKGPFNNLPFDCLRKQNVPAVELSF